MLRQMLFLLAALAFVISMLGCSEKKARVKRGDSTDETVIEEPSKDVVIAQGNPSSASPATTSAPKASANPFEGTWDVNSSGSFFNWTFGYATKKDQKLEGKITDATSAVIGDYVVLPNKTIELNVYAASINAIVPYKVSNSGNQIDMDDGPTKVSMTKGKSNTTAQNDGNVLMGNPQWVNISDPNEGYQFKAVRKSSSGWNGEVDHWTSSGPSTGTFNINSGKITTTIGGSVDVYKYRLQNGGVELVLTDSSGNSKTFK